MGITPLSRRLVACNRGTCKLTASWTSLPGPKSVVVRSLASVSENSAAAQVKRQRGELLLGQNAILAESTSAGVTTSYSAGPELEKLSVKEKVAPRARYFTGVQLTFAPTSRSKSVRDDLMGSLV